MKRRNFIKVTAAGSAGIASSLYIPQMQENRKLKIGLIGAGWYGMVITTAALKSGGVEIIGICDVDCEHLNTSADEIEKLQGTRPKTFKNYQDLLDLKDLKHYSLEQYLTGMPFSSLPAVKKVWIYIARNHLHTM